MNRLKAVLPFVFLAIFVILIITTSYAFAVRAQYPNLAQRGLIGDSFGALNAIFTGLAFAGVIYTMMLQKEEMELQRAALVEQKSLIDKQKTAIDNEQLEAKNERFASLFFNIINITSRQLQNLTFVNFANVSGSLAIRSLLGQLGNNLTDPHYMTIKGKFDTIVRTSYKNYLNYILSLENVLSFIHNSNSINQEQKEFYIHTFKTQLSIEELSLWYYSLYMADYSREGIKMLVRQYEIFDALRQEDLILPGHYAFQNMK